MEILYRFTITRRDGSSRSYKDRFKNKAEVIVHCEKVLEDNADIIDIAFEETEEERRRTRNH